MARINSDSEPPSSLSSDLSSPGPTTDDYFSVYDTQDHGAPILQPETPPVLLELCKNGDDLGDMWETSGLRKYESLASIPSVAEHD
jgi:hypothetical protein